MGFSYHIISNNVDSLWVIRLCKVCRDDRSQEELIEESLTIDLSS